MTIDEAIQKARSNENSFKNNHKLNLTLKERSPYYGLDCLRIADDNKHLAEWLEELKGYQQLEEQGRLIKLPCKVGDDIYYILGIPNETPCTIDKCTFELSDINKIGKTLFLTKSEAEAKLEELRGNND